jgi:DNA-directed RNA polymerase subunit RPC12/RpoP
MEQAFCPGSAFIRTPELTIKKCPECGEEVEVFSNDFSVKCEKCGFTVFNDQQSCIDWCKYARDCLGDEVYERLRGVKGEEGDEPAEDDGSSVPPEMADGT